MFPRAIAIVLLAALVAACGFQLRGQARLPAMMHKTHIAAADDSSAFVRELGLLLEASGVERVGRSEADAATLAIDSQRHWRQPLSVSGQARVREYLLIFEVDWRLVGPDGETVLEPETLRITRDYSFDEQEILAAQREEEFLRAELGRAMAARLVRRLESLAGARS